MRKWVFVVFVLSLSLLVPSCSGASDTGEEEKNIRQVFEKYLESVKTADLTVASQVWLQSPDLSAVTPLGRFKGWKSVQDDLYIKVLQQAFAERNLAADNIAITVAGDVAWAVDACNSLRITAGSGAGSLLLAASTPSSFLRQSTPQMINPPAELAKPDSALARLLRILCAFLLMSGAPLKSSSRSSCLRSRTKRSICARSSDPNSPCSVSMCVSF